MRLISAVIAGSGVLGVMPIAYNQLQGVACPKLGSVPACFVVLVAYVLIVAAAFLRQPWRGYVFIPAWLVVFAIAAIATGLELFTPNTCPAAKIGIPACFLSLAMALLLATAYVVERKADHDVASAS